MFNFSSVKCHLFVRFFKFFYLPLALFVRPSIYMVHTHLVLLYQFWIHTEVNLKLGLELAFYYIYIYISMIGVSFPTI